MIIFSLLVLKVFSLTQINPLANQQYFQRLDKLFEIDGLQTVINQPSLGFQIQGGIVGGVQNSFSNQSIVSSCQLDLIYLVVLQVQNKTYGASILKLVDNTTYVVQKQIQNITNSYTCQGINAESQQFIVIPCYAANGQVIIFIWNDQLYQYNTSLVLNTSQLQQLSIYVYKEVGYYSMELCVRSVNSSVVYSLIYKAQQFQQIQQIWQETGHFLQLYVSDKQQVFALSSQSLIINIQNRSNIYGSNNQKYLSFSLALNNNMIYILTNTSIISLFYNLGINQTISLPYAIKNGSICTSYKLLYILTQNQTLTYKYNNKNYLEFSQFYNIGFNYTQTQLSPMNYIITFNNSVIQIYQQQDYYLYNTQPNQSGFINFTQYFINGTQSSNQSLFANIVSNYSGQLLPKQYLYNGSQLSYDSKPIIKINLGDLYEGPSIDYIITQDSISGIILKLNLISLLEKADVFNNYPLQSFDGYLFFTIVDQIFYIQISALQEEVSSDTVFTNNYSQTNNIEIIKVMEFNNFTLLSLLISNDSIFVYYIEPLILTQYCYQLNLTEQYNISSINPNDVLVINQNTWVLYNQIFYVIQLGLYDFELISQQISYSQLSFISFIDYSLLFSLNQGSNYINVQLINSKNKMMQLSNITLPQNLQGLVSYIVPLDECIIVLGVQNNITYLYYFQNDVLNMIDNKSYYYEIISYNVTFQTSQMAYSKKVFYIWVQNETKNYINYYTCTTQINQPVNQITVLGAVESISAYSSILFQYDLITYQAKSVVYVEINPFISQLLVFPIFQLTPQLYVDIPMQISNWNYSESIYLNITINQDFLNLNNSAPIQSISIQQQSLKGQLSINPYNIFNGSIQNYIVYCENCNSFNYTNILSQGCIYFQKNSAVCNSYIQNNTQILYFATDSDIYSYNTSINNPFPTSPLLQNQTLVYKTDGNPYDVVLMTFLEVNTNALSWLYANNTQLYVVSMINGTPQYLFLNYASDSTFGLYQDGFLQMSFNQSYYCYYYSIQNSTQNLIIVSNGILIPVSQTFTSPFINITQTSQYIVFGTLLQNSLAGIYGILLNVSLAQETQYQLISYKIFNLYEILPSQSLQDAQQIQQLNNPYMDGNLTVIELVYTTFISAGRIALLFDKMLLVDYRQDCILNLINATFEQQFYNQIAANQNQVAIINTASSKDETQLLLSLYKVDDSICYNNNIVQPYLIEILDIQSTVLGGYSLVQFLNSSQLIISYGLNTTIYTIQQDIQIEYNTSTNGYINITAYNPIYNSTQLIYLVYNNNDSHKLAWYWITLIVILSIIVIVGLSILIYFKCKSDQSDNDFYQNQKNEIEIK